MYQKKNILKILAWLSRPVGFQKTRNRVASKNTIPVKNSIFIYFNLFIGVERHLLSNTVMVHLIE